MKNTKLLLKLALPALLLLVLVNPSWIPFLDSGVKNAIAAELDATFGILFGSADGALAPAKIVSALAAGLFVYILTTLVCFLLTKSSAGRKRSETVAGLLRSLVMTVGAISGLVWVLSILGVNLGAIFASLGIASLIIGFGVQSLIEDCVTGIFIILENEYNVGDIIVLEDFRGTVKKISMRTTTIEDDGGNLKVINNSDIRNVQNRSMVNSLVPCDLPISYDADLKQVEKILQDSLPDMFLRNMDVFETVPVYAGVQAMADSAILLRVRVDAKEDNIYAASRRLNRELKLMMDEHGLEIPFNQLVVHNAK